MVLYPTQKHTFSGSQYIGGDIAELPAVRFAYERAQVWTKYAMRNWSATGNITTTQPTGATYNPTSGELVLTIPSASVDFGTSTT